MRRMLPGAITAAALSALVGGIASAAHAAPCDRPDNVQFVTGGNECLLIHTARGSAAATGGPLFIFLHGDYSHDIAVSDRFFQKADDVVRMMPTATAVAMLRPGYKGPSGLGSTGDSNDHHDNETAENIDDIAGAIQTLKSVYHPSRLILIGHSGGAQVSAVILARRPHLADGAVLVSGPFDLAQWKAAFNNTRPYRSESPILYVDRLPTDARVVVIEGTADTNTFPRLAEQYTAALKARGVPVQLIEVPGADHDGAFNAPAVYQSAVQLAQ